MDQAVPMLECRKTRNRSRSHTPLSFYSLQWRHDPFSMFPVLQNIFGQDKCIYFNFKFRIDQELSFVWASLTVLIPFAHRSFSWSLTTSGTNFQSAFLSLWFFPTQIGKKISPLLTASLCTCPLSPLPISRHRSLSNHVNDMQELLL